MSSAIYLAIPLMVLLAIGQTAVLPRFPVAGVVPLLSLLLALAWGLLRGAGEGAVWGFVAGLCLDLFSVGPTGVGALTYMVTILLVILVGATLPPNRYLMPILMAALATPVLFVLNLVAMRLFGYPAGSNSFSMLLPTILLHSGLIVPFYWVTYALERTVRPRKVAI